MYSKEVTAIIIQDWGKGAGAEETRKHLLSIFGKAPCINTIYTHRKGLTAQDLVNELVNQQQRGITKQDTDNPELALRYRDSLIRTLYPQVNINLNKSESVSEVKHVIEFVDPPNSPEAPDQIQASPRSKLIPLVNGEIQNPLLR